MTHTDAAGFVLLSDVVPHIVQEIRYFSTFNFVGDRVDGYEEPIALMTREAARALKSVSNEMMVNLFPQMSDLRLQYSLQNHLLLPDFLPLFRLRQYYPARTPMYNQSNVAYS